MRYLPCLLLSLLAACAAAPEKPVAPANDEAANAVYAQIDAAGQRFDGAVRNYEAGDLEAATREFAGARSDLRALGERCIALAGCEVARVLAAQDALLERQARFLSGATEDAAPLDADETTAGEGDSPLVRALPQAARSV